jgi:predicted nucleic acid-binding protein
MFLLDTDVISELRKAKSGRANRNVVKWARSVSATALYLSAITILELETGVLLIERRDVAQGATLREWLDSQVLSSFAGRIIAIDTAVARCCASLHVPNRRADHDAFIAATALLHGMTVVTRNVADFGPTGVKTIDPWHGGT